MNKFFQNSQEYLRGLFLAIQEAKKDIYFTAYAITYNANFPPLSVTQIIEELVNARQRGVKIYGVVNQNLNLPKVKEQTIKAISELQVAGCEIKAFPETRICHAKVFIIDNYQIFIGSQNLTDARSYGQIEATVLIEDPELARQIKSFISLLQTIEEEETV